MKSIYLVRACLPGYDINSDYLLLAESKKDAKNKLLDAFPNSEISYVEKKEDNLVFETRGLASSPLMGCCKQTDKNYEKYKNKYLEEYGNIKR